MADNLDQEIAELCSVARHYHVRHQLIRDFACPPGKQIAVNFTADFDAMLLR